MNTDDLKRRACAAKIAELINTLDVAMEDARSESDLETMEAIEIGLHKICDELRARGKI